MMYLIFKTTADTAIWHKSEINLTELVTLILNQLLRCITFQNLSLGWDGAGRK
jgi:hypothetical protein